METKDKQLDRKQTTIDTLLERNKEIHVLFQAEQKKHPVLASAEPIQDIGGTDDESSQPPQTKQSRGEWRTALISLVVILLIALVSIAVWFFVIQEQNTEQGGGVVIKIAPLGAIYHFYFGEDCEICGGLWT